MLFLRFDKVKIQYSAWDIPEKYGLLTARPPEKSHFWGVSGHQDIFLNIRDIMIIQKIEIIKSKFVIDL